MGAAPIQGPTRTSSSGIRRMFNRRWILEHWDNRFYSPLMPVGRPCAWSIGEFSRYLLSQDPGWGCKTGAKHECGHCSKADTRLSCPLVSCGIYGNTRYRSLNKTFSAWRWVLYAYRLDSLALTSISWNNLRAHILVILLYVHGWTMT
jgi:hypothetical protein